MKYHFQYIYIKQDIKCMHKFCDCLLHTQTFEGLLSFAMHDVDDAIHELE